MREKKLILVIDDLESNLQTAGHFLLEAGFEVSLINDGKKGIEVAKRAIPDLILLDIVMPGVNGIEVCKLLKNEELTKEIPIIFLTSMKEKEQIVEGFDAGAVDYIIKPANKYEALARIRTHLELKQARETMIEQNKKLKDLFEEKRAFFEVSSSQLMSPINSIRGYNDQIKVYNLKNDNSAELQNLTQQIEINARSASSTVNDLLYLYNLEEGNLPSVVDSFNINLMIKKIIEEFEPEVKVNRLKIVFDTEVDMLTYAVADKDKVEVVLKHILSNAIKYSHFFKLIQVNAKVITDKRKLILVDIIDQGVGMSSEDLNNVFEKYSQLSPKTAHGELSVGLGMYTVKKLIEEIGGVINIRSAVEQGTSVRLCFPAI
ncbi:MAG: hybrid sensor histidine kinase/response regulator [Candidatus Kapabacteria bacterium]|nr:hybrid sensor histidine kinase/response regulator [Ignavibacteriota bacterium]MCW5885533.1 hybrid sensor histidine kinase/response regulator [Candidatus Kapabacteria bacterium]